MTDPVIASRLEYLRGEIRAERISQAEVIELQGLARHVEPGDTELLEWAGVTEFPDAPSREVIFAMRAIVDYNWRDEERDYEECKTNDNETEGHVFELLQQVDKYLTEQGV